MVKTKAIDYPSLKFDEAIQSVKILIEKLNGEAKNPDSFASLLGHTNSKSSAFIVKVGDLRRYGLIERRGDIKATSLAKEIVHPVNETEKQNATNQIIINVDLWRMLYEKIGRNVPPENEFWTQLVEVSNIDRNVAIKEADKIRKLYIDAMTYYKDKNEFSNLNLQKEENKNSTKRVIKENMITANSGDVYIEMPKDKRYIKIVESLLANLKAQIELEEYKE